VRGEARDGTHLNISLDLLSSLSQFANCFSFRADMVDGDPTPSSSDETVEGTIEGAEDRIQFLKWWEVSEREGDIYIYNCLP
jgi:hypothetical protein